MDVEITSDNLKQQIIDFKKREKQGLIERYEGSEAQTELGGEALNSNLGTFKKPKSEIESADVSFSAGKKPRGYI